MKKILIFANNSNGLFMFRNELIRELIRQGNEVISYTPFDLKVDELIGLGMEVKKIDIDRRGMNPLKDIKLFKTFRKILRIEKPDLVITYTIKPNIYGGIACRFSNIPYVVNITGLGTAFENGGAIKQLVTVMNRISCKKAKTVFFENEGNRQIFIQEKIVKEFQTCRLNGAGVNVEKFRVTEYPTGEKIRFLFIGRIMAEKGINELIEAMRKLIADGIDCELNVLGKYEEDYRDVIEKCELEGWLIYHGFQDDVRPFIETCHCFVLPSWHEGMANTNLECAASGRPVITSNIFGCKESIINEISGFLVEKRNSKDLYRAMKKFSKLTYEERKNMGLSGRKHMEQVFDKKKVVADTISRL